MTKKLSAPKAFGAPPLPTRRIRICSIPKILIAKYASESMMLSMLVLPWRTRHFVAVGFCLFASLCGGCSRKASNDKASNETEVLKAEVDSLKKQVDTLRSQSSIQGPETNTELEKIKAAYRPYKLSGSVRYRTKAGKVVVQSGLSVRVFDPLSAKLALMKTHYAGAMIDMDIRLNAPALKQDGGADLLSKFSDLFRSVEEVELGFGSATTKTDFDGKYSISVDSVPPSIKREGSYYIYAALDTSAVRGYWLLPIDLADEKNISLDLDNTNMTRVYDATD